MTMPSQEICDRARRARDARFDGLFFTGVRSTRIYCRPVCPAPSPKPCNIVYFSSAAAAAAAGYRPCLRCRPELSPDARPRDETVRRSLAAIADGWLEEGTVESLATAVGLSARHLRRCFLEQVGATPMQVDQTRRVSLAKQLLTETSLPIVHVALAAGFASVRRFNDAFQARSGMAPSAVRRSPDAPRDDFLRLRLAYRPPFDFAATLAVLRDDRLAGIERVDEGAWLRNVAVGRRSAWIAVTADAVKPELLLRVTGVEPRDIQALVRRVRRQFDLDADLQAARDVLVHDAVLARSIAQRAGLRIAGAWSGFECAVQCALRLGTAVDDARTSMDRLIERYGEKIGDAPLGLDRRFPDPATLATTDLANAIGLSAGSAAAVRRVALAVRDRQLHFGPAQALDGFVEHFVATTRLPLVDAHHVAYRALGDPDAWPLGDSGTTPDPGRAASWRPWRSYGALHLMAA